MWEDRRSHARYPCLITGELRPAAGGFLDVVCTSISRGGAFLSCKNPLGAASKFTVVLRPLGLEGPAIEASGEVAWSSPRGAATPPGCGVRWHSLRCSSGEAPLRQFAELYLRWLDLGPLPIDPAGCAWLRLDGKGKLSGGFIAEMAAGTAAAPGHANAAGEPAGTMPTPAGTVLTPAGPVLAPAGTVPAPAGTVLTPAGPVLAPAGTVPAPAGTVPRALGAVLGSDRGEPVALPVEPTADRVGPIAMAIAPIAMATEPTAMAGEPLAADAEVAVLRAEPTAVNAEPLADFADLISDLAEHTDPMAEPRLAEAAPSLTPMASGLPRFGVAAAAQADAATDPDNDLLAPGLGWRRPPATAAGAAPNAAGLGFGGAASQPPADAATQRQSWAAEATDPGVPLGDAADQGWLQPVGLRPSPLSALVAPARAASSAQAVALPPAPPPVPPAVPRRALATQSGAFHDDLPAQLHGEHGAETPQGRHGTNPGTGAVLPTLSPLSAVTARMEALDVGLWQHGADPDQLLQELAGGLASGAPAAVPLAAPPAGPPPVPVSAAETSPKSYNEQTFAYGNDRDALMAEMARARAARAVESGLVPLVASGARPISAGYAPVVAKAPPSPRPPSEPLGAAPLAPVERHSAPQAAARPRQEPGVALRHGPLQPVLQQWPAGVPRALSGRYQELQILGHGGHGVVYRARDAALDRFVVIKLLMPSALGTEMARRYFQREVKVAASLNHPNIVHIYDVGEADGTLWYAMEYVDGVPLAQYLLPGKPLEDMGFLYSVVSQLCEALDHAHGQGILHRDVKPDNVLVAADGTVKLFDFGLARGADQGFGEQSLLLGTPYYMAPEQLSGGKVTAATDAYALGVLLFRLLTGEVPFSKGNVFAAHVLEPVPDPRKLQPGIADAVVPVVMRLLAKRAEDRYASCHQAAVELWQALFG